MSEAKTRSDLRPMMRCTCEVIDGKVTDSICHQHLTKFQSMHRAELRKVELSGTPGEVKTNKQMLEWIIAHPHVTVRETKPSGYVAFDVSSGLSTLAKCTTYQETIRKAAAKMAE